MAQFGTPGVATITNQTDAAIGPAGKIIRVFSAHSVSGATAAVVNLYNGTSTGGVLFARVDGIISKGGTLDFANGLLFPDGCFADVDANTVALTVSFSVEL